MKKDLKEQVLEVADELDDVRFGLRGCNATLAACSSAAYHGEMDGDSVYNCLCFVQRGLEREIDRIGSTTERIRTFRIPEDPHPFIPKNKKTKKEKAASEKAVLEEEKSEEEKNEKTVQEDNPITEAESYNGTEAACLAGCDYGTLLSFCEQTGIKKTGRGYRLTQAQVEDLRKWRGV